MFAASVVFTVSFVRAQDVEVDAPKTKTRRSREQLRDTQLDVSLEARDIERIVGRLKRASDLAKQRVTEAASTAEAVSTALDRKDAGSARDDALRAVAMFREIAKQLEALLQEETPQRVAAAKNLARELAQAEREFAKQFPGALNNIVGGSGKRDPRSQIPATIAGRPPSNSREGPPAQDKPPPNPNSSQGQNPDSKTADVPTQAGAAADRNARDRSREGEGQGKERRDDRDADGDREDPKDAPDAKNKNAGRGDKADREEKPEMGAGGGEKSARESAEARRAALARRAEELAEKGRTLQDVLKSISESTEPADQKAAGQVASILRETELGRAIEAIQDARTRIRQGQFVDVQRDSEDLADRLEIVAGRLDGAYQQIVAPAAEELRELEQRLSALRDRLETLETPTQVMAWHREARQLLDRMDAAGVSEELQEALVEAMRRAGFGVDATNASRVPWQVAGGRYVPPRPYAKTIIALQEDVQSRLQSLVIGDIRMSAEDTAPPKFRELVDRYIQVLSQDTSAGERSAPQRATGPKGKGPPR